MKKVIEYNSPSGFVIFYNYKEPLMRNENPYFGFKGAVLYDEKNQSVQCNVCGKWKKSVGAHVKSHKLTVKKYKHKFGLSPQASLVCEDTREKFIICGKKGFEAMKKKYGEEFLKNRTKGLKHYKHISMEQRNKNGTCPAQLLDRLQKVKNKLGRQPSYNEVKKYTHGANKTIIKVFGSWKNAIKLLGWDIQKQGQSFGEPDWTKEKLLSLLRNFKKKYNREPVGSDYRRRLLPSITIFQRKFGTFRNAKGIAYGYYKDI